MDRTRMGVRENVLSLGLILTAHTFVVHGFEDNNTMTEKAEKPRYPMMNVNQWWALREKFKSSLPRSGIITPRYLATVLSTNQSTMTEKSARDNILAPLRIMTIVDKDGKLNDQLIESWRSDSDYQSACETIREAVYPHELLDALPSPDPDLEAAKNWFMRSARVGDLAAKRMASTYLLISQADPEKSDTRVAKPRASVRNVKPKLPTNPSSKQEQDEPIQPHEDSNSENQATKNQGDKIVRVDPSVHIDIQIHISPESTDKQIETIFASMARHLYGNKSISDD